MLHRRGAEQALRNAEFSRRDSAILCPSAVIFLLELLLLPYQTKKARSLERAYIRKKLVSVNFAGIIC